VTKALITAVMMMSAMGKTKRMAEAAEVISMLRGCC
jgi:hypothetical protein